MKPHELPKIADFQRRYRESLERRLSAKQPERSVLTQAEIDEREPQRPARRFQPLEWVRQALVSRLHG